MNLAIALISAALFVSGTFLVIGTYAYCTRGYDGTRAQQPTATERIVGVSCAGLYLLAVVTSWIMQRSGSPLLLATREMHDVRLVSLIGLGMLVAGWAIVCVVGLGVRALTSYALSEGLPAWKRAQRVGYWLSLLVMFPTTQLAIWADWHPWRLYLGRTGDIAITVIVASAIVFLITGWRGVVSILTTGRVLKHADEFGR